VGFENQTDGAVAEDLSGGTWTPTSPYGASDETALACPAIESCVAVGATTISTLSNGVWNVTTVPVPANAGVEPFPHDPNWPDASVSSVSCATIDSCAALGQYGVPDPPYPDNEFETLIETLGLGGVQTPVIAGSNEATFKAGQTGTLSLTASGTVTPVLSETGKLPKGLHFTTGGGTATITGKPSKKAGSFSVRITATVKSTNERIGQPVLITISS
jgi:hypothetical protein